MFGKGKTMPNELILCAKKIWKRNSKILNAASRKTVPNRVNLHWWSLNRSDGVENLGDYLSWVICQYLLKQKGLTLDTEIRTTKHLYSVGSIIQGGAQNATIWGSGLKKKLSGFDRTMRLYRKLDIRLVRGPSTRAALQKEGYKCPESYGDPALIMPMIYQPRKQEKRDVTIILHKDTNQDIPNSITPLVKKNEYKAFIDRIFNSKLVISSSLHGIVLAETYGIPAILLSDVETSNLFKYEDYYSSTGRQNFPVAASIEEALAMQPAEIPDLMEIRKNIVDTFPYDLWE